MSRIADILLNQVKSFLSFLFKHFVLLFADLGKASDGIPLKYLINDFMSVLRSSGVFLILNILAFLVFTVLPQGKDILLIVVEDVGVQHRPGNLFCLVVGILVWSIITEFGTRYAIYVTDNSAKSISDSRVRWRKEVQKAVAQIFLM